MINDNSGIHLGGTARSPEDVTALHALGLHFAEVSVQDLDTFLTHKEAYQALRTRLGLYYLCHGPREGDPNDTTSLETVYLPKLFHILSIMPELAMNLLTIHLWMDPRFVSRRAIEYKVGLLRRLTSEATELGISLCLENMSEKAAHLAPVFEALPHLYLTLDLAHAQLLSEENTSFGFMGRFPERIRHIHAHDNLGGNTPADDLHLPVGQGSIDFERIFKRLRLTGYQGTITLELRPKQIETCLDYVRAMAMP
jgi:sugar phosphate isomerase/epimerase